MWDPRIQAAAAALIAGATSAMFGLLTRRDDRNRGRMIGVGAAVALIAAAYLLYRGAAGF
ncbi:MAG: hypothetical protein GXX99_06455 [Clostridiales bacterium]|nr:hypothetical protein [Clostridiales bacterium]